MTSFLCQVPAGKVSDFSYFMKFVKGAYFIVQMLLIVYKPCQKSFKITKFSTKYFILSKIYSDEGGINQLCHGIAKARGLSPRTGGQTMVYLLLNFVTS